MLVANPVLRRTFQRSAAFDPLEPGELARFVALVDEVVADIRKARGDGVQPAKGAAAGAPACFECGRS